MKLKKLDLFAHFPKEVLEKATPEDSKRNRTHALFKANSRTTGIEIIERVSQVQERPLEWLTFHFSRNVLDENSQAYLMQAKMQLRRSNRVDGEGDKKYEIRE